MHFCNNKWLAFVFGAVLIGIVSTPVHAQERGSSARQESNIPVSKRVPEGYRSSGMRYKGFIISPRLDVEALYNSNIYAQSNDTQGGYFTKVRPSVEVSKNYNAHELFFGASADVERHFNFTNRNKEDYNFYTRGTISGNTKWSFPFSLEYDQRARDASTPTGSSGVSSKPADITRTSLSAGIVRRFNRLRVGLKGLFSDVSYENGTSLSNGAPIIYDDADRKAYGGTLDLGYQFPRGNKTNSVEHSLFASFRLGKQLFDKGQYINGSYSGAKADRVDQGALIGFQTDYKRLVFAKLAGGITRQDFDESSIKPITKFDFLADVQYNIMPKATLSFDAGRRISQDTETSVGIVNSNYDLGLDYEFYHNFYAGGSLGFETHEFSDSGRTDKDYKSAVYGRYLINDKFEGRAQVGYVDRDSTSPTKSYDSWTLMLGLTGKL